jgi:ATP-dependent helicase/nuclease subunit A
MARVDPRQFDAQAMATAAAVQRQALAAGKSVWISANAGTGKTEVLTQRLLALLLQDATLEPRHLLALTFTKAGATEMAARLPERLEKWAALDEAALALEVEAALGLKVGGLVERVRVLAEQVRQAPPLVATIHSLAQQLLTRFAVEAGLEPGFEVLDEGGQARLLNEVQHQLLVNVDGVLAENLAVLLDELGEHGWRDVTRVITQNWKRLDERLREGGPAAVLARVQDALGLKDEAWVKLALVPHSEEWAVLRRVAPLLPGHEIWSVLTAAEDEVEEAWRGFLLTDKGTARARIFLKAEAAKLADADVAVITAAAARVAEAVRQRKAWRGLTVTRALVVWAMQVKGAYGQAKQARGVVDYDDLLDGLERLLVKADAGLAAWMWYGFDRRFRHLVVDEAQDNNPQQNRIVQWLARNILSGDVGEASARTVLAVGDVKQSILRFQGADPALFVGLREALYAWAPGRVVEVDLAHSFRSGPEVLAAVDAVFAAEGLSERVQGEDRGWPGHRAVAAARLSRVELWPLEANGGKPQVEPWALPWVRSEAEGDNAGVRLFRRMAAWLEDKIGRVVMPSTGLPLRPEDVMLVVRTNAVGGLAAGVLRAAGLPVASTRGVVPLAVQDVVALVRVIFNTADNLSLAQVLKGFLKWNDAHLLALGAQVARGGVWAEALEGEDKVWLEGWLARAGETPLALVHAAMVARGGKRSDFDGLLAWAAECETLRELVRRCEQEEIAVKSEGAGIRILTVQKAKGLQAPLVILPQTRGGGGTDKLLWGDGVLLFKQAKGTSEFEDTLLEEEEARREVDDLRGLYVAMTRASDWLVVTGYGGKEGQDTSGTWWGHLDSLEGWREVEGVKVRGSDFGRVEKAVAEVPVAEAKAAVVVRGVEVAEAQTPAQVRGELVHALLQGLTVPAEVGVVAEVERVRAALPWVFEKGRSEVSVALEGGRVGRIDRLVEKDGDVWVIDFKTGVVLEPMPEDYVAQVKAYMAAARASYPGKTVRGAVVWTAGAKLVPVD